MKRTLMVLIGIAWSLTRIDISHGQLIVECIPLDSTTVNGGELVTIECFLTTDITRTFVSAQLDLACSLPPKTTAGGTVNSIGIAVDPLHTPEPWFLIGTGGGVNINQQLCGVSQNPGFIPGQVTFPGGTTVYLATIEYTVSDCAFGSFNIILENYSNPPHFTDDTRFMEYPGNIDNVLPFNFTPATLTVETGSCCLGGKCVVDDLNELCCSQTYSGASFFPGRSCADVLPCGLCTSDSECDDSDFCNGAEGCDFSTGQCLPGTPPNCDDNLFCNGQEICDPENGCFPGATPCAQGLECDEDRDECFIPGIPTVSTWGLAVLGLLLAAGAKVRFRGKPQRR